jgi:hypothetical protein
LQLDALEYLYIRLSVAFAGLRRLLPLVLHSSAVESGVGGGGRHMRWWQSHAAERLQLEEQSASLTQQLQLQLSWAVASCLLPHPCPRLEE